MVKRFNDRDRPWWFGWAVSAAMLAADCAPHFGVLIDPEAPLPNAIAFWLVLALLLASIIDNGFLCGTAGPNRYGDDPLASKAVPAAA
jgi:uncharacterized membrane protein YhaH (DUF805 family)